jgi:hypothetical protein
MIAQPSITACVRLATHSSIHGKGNVVPRSIKVRAAFVAIAVPVALGLSVVTATSAFAAGNTVSTTGGSLTCNVYQTAKFRGYADCWLTDTAADSRQVYAVTQVERFPTKRTTNNRGSGQTITFRERIDIDSRFEYRYKVCRQVNLGGDNCAGWRTVKS